MTSQNIKSDTALTATPMQMFKRWLCSSYPYRLFNVGRSYVAWVNRSYSAPSPHFIKQAVVLRNALPHATWVETGTFLGETTRLLAKQGSFVYSIEPEPTLYANAHRFFKSYANVEIIHGLSENVFPTLLPTLSGDINFWLDGHYSAGPTHKGPQDTPILDELKCIAANLTHFKNVRIMVDDVRCFNPHLPDYASYPTAKTLVDWAEQHRLHWHIEHDIFVAGN